MRKLTFSIAVATLATAATAIAAPGAGGHRMPQGDMTRAQAEAMAAEHFAKMDANGDGVLNQADREAMKAKMMARVDTNGDGTVSAEERAAAKAARPARPEGAAPRGDKKRVAGEGGKRHDGKMAGHRGGPGMMGKKADANGDGAVDRAEFTAAALARFDASDADRNGTVTDAERDAARAAMKAKWEAAKAERQAN